MVLMNADWYIDPLGRFDGRFFDGERWTERVSDDGVLAIDNDFPPAASQFDDVASAAPAVKQVHVGRNLQASLIEESPARTVAILDEAVARGRTIDSGRRSPSSGRAPVVWGLLALVAALAVAALVLTGNDDASSSAATQPIDLEPAQEARVQDLESGGLTEESQAEPIEELEVDAPAGAVAPGTTFDASEAIEVGGLRVLNGESVLADLSQWHAEFAADRGIVLDPLASCWFGQLGGAAVQVAHCGPVGGSEASEFLFDSVPLVFEEDDQGQIAQPVVDAVTVDAVLANALTLVGREGDAPPELSDGAGG